MSALLQALQIVLFIVNGKYGCYSKSHPLCDALGDWVQCTLSGLNH